MPFHKYISPDYGSCPTIRLGGILAVWRLTESSTELLQLLTEEERVAFVGMGLSEKRLCEKVATRLLLETMEETRGAQLGYTSEGAPYLLNRKGYISISHTRGWVAVAYHPTRRIGIDIERMGEQVPKVAPRVLSNRELNACLDTPTPSVWLHLYWSAKEALFKAIPESGIDFREHLHIEMISDLSTEGNLMATETCTAEHRQYWVWYRADNEWVVACALPTVEWL